MKFRILLIFGFLFYKNAVSQTITVKQYIDTFKNIAMREMLEYKIPASITLAQGLLESGSGNSRLAKQGNNHFGIKCKKDWTGCTILEDDDALQECFRCYAKAEDSYKDHSRFLKENKRYAALFLMDISDYKSWAKGLLAAGYATNQKYADLLISTIERNKLMQYDSMVISGYNPYNTQIPANIDLVYNKVPSTVVQQNETIDKIANVNNKTINKLIKYNDLNFHSNIEPGDVLYLKPKKRKASVSNHEVKEGETMWEISQKYAIRMSSLYKKNLMDIGTEPQIGVILNLQTKASSRPDTVVKNVDQAKSENFIIHYVSMGETLYSISQKYNVSVEDIKTENGLKNDQISLGMELKIQKPQKGAIIVYKVQSGDTLYSISRKFSVSVEEIKSWNKISDNSINVGQTIEIRTR
jgi:LysM repeat protein